MRASTATRPADPPTPAGDPPLGVLERLAGVPGGRRTRWLILLGWIVIMAVAGPFASRVGEVENNEAASFLPRSAEATQVDALSDRFPQDGSLPAVVVFARADGLTSTDKAAIDGQVEALREYALDGQVGPPTLSEDGQAATVRVPIEFGDGLTEVIGELREVVRADLPAGLQVAVGGPAGELTDSVEVFGDLDANLLIATATVVAILLLLTYRSPVLWLLPLVSVGVASQLANAVVYLLGAHADLPVNGQSAGILTILVFGIGTDYALLLVARYREELHRHSNRFTAMALAMRHAAPALLASAGTVIAGLLCLLLADLNSNRSLGGVGAVGVFAGALVMLTLLPALLVLLGRWVFWPRIPQAGTPMRQGKGWVRIAAGLRPRPRLVWIGTAAALAVLALAASGLQVGLTQDQAYTTTPESVTAQRQLADHYPAGSGAPTEVVARTGAAGAVLDSIESIDGVSAVQEPVPSTDGALVRIPVVLTDAPDSDEAKETVRELRATVGDIPQADALVGGPSAILLDSGDAADRDRKVVIPLVLLAVLLILIGLLRAVVAPVLLMGTVVLSFFAALGAAKLVLEGVLGVDTLDQSTPLLGFVFLVALGVDYNIFLVHRIRQEARIHGHDAGVRRGLVRTGAVITSAGLVLAATFTVLATLPLVSLAGLGVLVAVGVLIDTFIVRSILVPALLLDTGRRAWWPGRLAGARR